jgi:hypothetical protein
MATYGCLGVERIRTLPRAWTVACVFAMPGRPLADRELRNGQLAGESPRGRESTWPRGEAAGSAYRNGV